MLAAAEQSFCELVRRLVPTRAGDTGPGDALATLDAHVRFVADPGYANPGREVVRVRRSQGRFEVAVNRFVLAGLHGPLPEPYQELAVRRAAAGDRATAAFLDLFNHRINLLRFWIQARHLPGLSARRPRELPLVRLVAALVDGRMRDEAPSEPTLSAAELVAVAGLLRHPDRSLSVVEKVLERMLGLVLTLRPFAGGWVGRHPSSFSRLGADNCRLGRDSVVGTRIWDSGKGLHLQLRCRDRQEFLSVLPSGSLHARLRAVLRWLTCRRFDVHVECIVPAGAEPLRLDGIRLGYTTQMGAEAPGSVAQPVRFTIYAEDEDHDVDSAA